MWMNVCEVLTTATVILDVLTPLEALCANVMTTAIDGMADTVLVSSAI